MNLLLVVLAVAAVILCGLATFGVGHPRVNLFAGGVTLALLVGLVLLLGSVHV